MKKKILVCIPILVIFVSILSFIVMKVFYGTSIKHYKQFIIPAKGQIVTCAGAETNVKLCLIDEIELSEIAEKGNIKGITFGTDKGETIQATDWEVENEYPHSGDYEMKELLIKSCFEKEVYLTKVMIQYVDTVEEFEIGRLRIYPITGNPTPYNIYIYNSLIDASNDTSLLSKEKPKCLFQNFTVLQFEITSNLEPFKIQTIDLGIQGMGIIPSTLKNVSEDIDFGEEFYKYEENEKFMKKDSLDKLPEQKLNMGVSNKESEGKNYLISVRKSKEYVEDFSCIYINPLYYCYNETEKKEFVCASLDYMKILPVVLDSNYAIELLEEKGR